MSNSTSVRSDKVCVVVGVGEGLGAALARRFAAGYKVALIARSAEVIGKVGREIKDTAGRRTSDPKRCNCRVANRIRARAD